MRELLSRRIIEMPVIGAANQCRGIGALPPTIQQPPDHEPEKYSAQQVLLRVCASRQHDVEDRQTGDHVVRVVQPLPVLRSHGPDRGVERGRAQRDQTDGRERRDDQRQSRHRLVDDQRKVPGPRARKL